SASGNADEEFWYQNAPSHLAETFPETMPHLPGASAYREIQVLLDGKLIAAASPFAHIFTGGINPGLWRPIVSIGTFDVGEIDIDITPFLPFILPSASTANMKGVYAPKKKGTLEIK